MEWHGKKCWNLRSDLTFIIFCVIFFTTTAKLFALPIQAVDSVGRPIDIREELGKAPELFHDEMKMYLKRGNLEGAGYLAKQMLEVEPHNSVARAIYSIALCAEGSIAKAEKELKNARMGSKESQFTLYAEAMILRSKRQYNRATRVCKKAISMDKKHPYPWNILGRIYFDQGQYRKAVVSFQEAIKLFPDFVIGHINLGAVFYTTGDYHRSMLAFKRAIAINPGSSSAHYGLALVYEAQKQNSLAISEIKKSLRYAPNTPSFLKKLAELQLKESKFEQALATGKDMEKLRIAGFNEILAEASLHLGKVKEAISYLEKTQIGSPNARYVLGFCFLAEGRYEDALKSMESVLHRDRNHFGAFAARAALLLYLDKPIAPEKVFRTGWGDDLDKLIEFLAGGSYAANGDWGRAMESWRSAEGLIGGFSIEGINGNVLQEVSKKNEFKYINLGVIYYFRDLEDYALVEFEKALSVNPNSILGNYWVAQTYLKKHDRTRALEFLVNATKKAPEFFSALYAIGELNFLLGKQEVARKYYERAVSVKNDAGILIKLGLIYENLKQYKKAENVYEKIINSFPKFFVGYNQLAWLYAKRGVELGKAMDLANKANEIQPGNASILDTIAWIYFHKKRYDDALAKDLEANNIRSGNPTILYHIGAIYKAMGNDREARKYLKQALDLSKDFQDADVARGLLHGIE